MAHVDLSQLPKPDFGVAKTFDACLDGWLRLAVQEIPEFDATVEADPIRRLCRVGAYRESVARRDFEEALWQTLLAYAAGSNLDHVVALVNVQRKDGEGDDALRQRALVARGYSVAGPEDAYRALSAAVSGVYDVNPVRSAPGTVTVHVLGTGDEGEPAVASDALVAEVAAVLNPATVRPQTETVAVAKASILEYDITAMLELAEGPGTAGVLADAKASVEAFALARIHVGESVPATGVAAALYVPGVESAAIAIPVADVAVTAGQAPVLRTLTITESP